MVDYVNNRTLVIIICKIHNITFYQTPNNHYRTTGCMKCHNKGYSLKSILWLNLISIINNIKIQHAANGNEYTIPTTKMRADGYCKETNTIYEFHGDYWHGNPNRFLPTEINTTSKKTFGELYQNTLKREQTIKDLGYNLVVIWENEWHKINNSIRFLQIKFKCRALL